MILYIVILLYLLYQAFRHKSFGNTSIDMRAYKFSCIVLICLAAFRNKLGGDTYTYMNSFYYAPTFHDLSFQYLLASNFAPLWNILCASIKAIGGNFYLLQTVHAVVINVAFFYFFKKYSEKPFLCVLIYYIFFYFNYNTEILRSAVSAAIFLYAYRYMLEGRLKMYYILCIIALGFHYEAIVLFLFPLFNMIEINKRRKLAAITVIIVGLLFVISIDITKSDFLWSFVTENNNMEEYLTYEKVKLNINGIIAYSFGVIPYVILFMCVRVSNFESLLLLFVVLLKILTFRYYVLFSRMLDFCYPVVLIIVARTLQYKKREIINTNLKPLLLIGVFMLFYSWGQFYQGHMGGQEKISYKMYFPYTSWLLDEEDIERTSIVNTQRHTNY